MYSPVLGRFLSADTVVPGAGNPQAFNRYSYTSNNPIKYIDPSGHMWQDLVTGGGSLGGLYGGGGSAGEGASFVYGVLLFPLTVAVETVDTVASGVQCAGGDGWACVGAAVPFLSGAAAKGLGKVLGLVNDVPMGVADEVVESLTDGGKAVRANILDDLATGTPQSKRIAESINNGDIKMNILNNDDFNEFARSHGAVNPNNIRAGNIGNQMYLREISADIGADAVHEGTHALDNLDKFGVGVRRTRNIAMENRAYLYERDFQIFKGRAPYFEDLDRMFGHIDKNYR